jgi:hypothetical protein
VPKAHECARQERALAVFNAEAKPGGYPELVAPLLGQCVALLAMRYRRAPLPVPRALWKGLLRQGLANNTAELNDLARRYLFLGDARMMLAESRKSPTPSLNSSRLVKHFVDQGNQCSEAEDQCQCR